MTKYYEQSTKCIHASVVGFLVMLQGSKRTNFELIFWANLSRLFTKNTTSRIVA